MLNTDDLRRRKLELINIRMDHAAKCALPKGDEGGFVTANDEYRFADYGDLTYYERVTGHIEELDYLIAMIAAEGQETSAGSLPTIAKALALELGLPEVASMEEGRRWFREDRDGNTMQVRSYVDRRGVPMLEVREDRGGVRRIGVNGGEGAIVVRRQPTKEVTKALMGALLRIASGNRA